MQIRTKIVLLVLVALATWALEQYLFLGTGPTMTAEMAVQQLKSGNSPETLRLVDTSKNYFAVVIVGFFAFLLFARNIWNALGIVTGEAKQCPYEENAKLRAKLVALENASCKK